MAAVLAKSAAHRYAPQPVREVVYGRPTKLTDEMRAVLTEKIEADRKYASKRLCHEWGISDTSLARYLRIVRAELSARHGGVC